VVDFVYN